MRIAFDHQAFVMQSYGGISRYFTQVALGLLGMEQRVGVFAPLHRNNYVFSLPQGVVQGSHLNWYPPKSTRFFLTYNLISVRNKIARWKPDVVHETYYSKIASGPKSCPTVITVHDMIHELFPDDFSVYDNTIKNKRKAIDRADHVICVSENTKLDLMRLYDAPESKLSVVHHGFDQFVSQTNEMPVVTSGKPFLLYTGLRDGYKNFIGLLKAVSSSRRLLSDYDIVAFGGGGFSSFEKRLFSTLGFSENQVRYKSGDDELLGNLYSSARALVYPSLYEGFGIPPLEAMAHLCPVISSNTSSMPEVIGAACEYFDPTNTEDMCRAIESVVYSDSRILSLRAIGTERLTEFSWDKCTSQTLDIYRSLT